MVPEKDGVRRRVYGHSWSLVSGASTAVNCLVIYVAKLYEPFSTWPSPWPPPTPSMFLVLYWVEVVVGYSQSARRLLGCSEENRPLLRGSPLCSPC